MRTYKVEFYRSGIKKDWRWRVTATNGKVIGASTEGYRNRLDCLANVRTLGASLMAFQNTEEE